MKKLLKKLWTAFIALLISLSVIFACFGNEQQARPNSRREDEVSVSLEVEED